MITGDTWTLGIHGHGGYVDMGDTWTWGIPDHGAYLDMGDM